MRFAATFAALAAALPFTHAFYKGINIGANNEDGSCKTQQQWTDAFDKLKSTPQNINSVRLFASGDCHTLARAVPAALATNTKILVGVWASDDKYGWEKANLTDAISAHGHDWILAISVGSEDLYRNEKNEGYLAPSTLVNRINDIRSTVKSMKPEFKVEVGHVDTWTAWVNATNEAVIKASDFIGLDAYPYYQNVDIGSAYNTFWDAVTQTRNQVNKISSGKWVWITETGWPVTGQILGKAVPSVKNAQSYWHSVACEAFKDVHLFWYSYQDYNNQAASFGMFDKNGKAIYDLHAC